MASALRPLRRKETPLPATRFILFAAALGLAAAAAAAQPGPETVLGIDGFARQEPAAEGTAEWRLDTDAEGNAVVIAAGTLPDWDLAFSVTLREVLTVWPTSYEVAIVATTLDGAPRSDRIFSPQADGFGLVGDAAPGTAYGLTLTGAAGVRPAEAVRRIAAAEALSFILVGNAPPSQRMVRLVLGTEGHAALAAAIEAWGSPFDIDHATPGRPFADAFSIGPPEILPGGPARSDGTVSWAIEDGRDATPAIVATIDIPGDPLTLVLRIARAFGGFDLDARLSRHTAAITAIRLKPDPLAAGQPLAGGGSEGRVNRYALHPPRSAPAAAENLRLLREMGWFEVELTSPSGQPRLVLFAIGTEGRRLLEEILPAGP